MKYILTEEQFEKVKKTDLVINYDVFSNDWNVLQKFLQKRNNPPYTLIGNVLLNDTETKTLGSLVNIIGDLNIKNCPILTLGNLMYVSGVLNAKDSKLESLGNLIYVGDTINLGGTNIKSLGNLSHVGDDLYLKKTPLSRAETLKTKALIRSKIMVLGRIFTDLNT